MPNESKYVKIKKGDNNESRNKIHKENSEIIREWGVSEETYQKYRKRFQKNKETQIFRCDYVQHSITVVKQKRMWYNKEGDEKWKK